MVLECLNLEVLSWWGRCSCATNSRGQNRWKEVVLPNQTLRPQLDRQTIFLDKQPLLKPCKSKCFTKQTNFSRKTRLFLTANNRNNSENTGLQNVHKRLTKGSQKAFPIDSSVVRLARSARTSELFELESCAHCAISPEEKQTDENQTEENQSGLPRRTGDSIAAAALHWTFGRCLRIFTKGEFFSINSKESFWFFLLVFNV